MKLKNKNIIVTGASDGIGKSIAVALSKEGASLILFGRDQGKLKQVASECGNNASYYSFDLMDDDSRKKVVDQVLGKYKIDILINNAGIWHKAGDLETIEENKIYEVINTNLTSQILLTKQLLPSMIDRETVIINVISKSGIVAQKGQSVYTASKYGMKGFTDVLREDTKDNPIKIGAIYQSGVNTNMFSKVGEEFSTESFTEPKDIADVVVFMLSRPEKLWINEIHISR